MNKKKYNETTFMGLLKINGVSFFLNYTLLYSLLLFLFIHMLITNFNICSFEDYKLISEDIFSKISSISSSIFGIVIAALAVSMSVFNQKIVGLLENNKLLHKFLFPFWFLVLCWGVLILISSLMPIINEKIIVSHQIIFDVITGFTVWLFIYALFFSINITGLLIRLFIQNSKVS
ncbi:hypothetical protein [Paenisporosarcina sp. TG-14]|uniref:hypothetical protein n=1 Tax=Paenisporosarcina sp. TG-14 TaxID=1231057 RepID=UPI000319FCC3|nr:hypothetical protein [Paenisporosarcina sp. TG-14]